MPAPTPTPTPAPTLIPIFIPIPAFIPVPAALLAGDVVTQGLFNAITIYNPRQADPFLVLL